MILSIRKVKFTGLLSMLIVFTYSQNTDSLKQLILSKSGNAKAELFHELALIQYRSNDDSLALVNIENGLKWATEDKTKGELIYRKAAVYTKSNNATLQIKYLKDAIPLLINSNDSLAGEAMYWLHRGYQRTAMYAEALNSGFEELEFRKTKLNHDKLNLMRAYSEIGYTYDRMNEYTKAIEWHYKALPLAKKLNSPADEGWVYGLIGIAYDELAKYDSALFYNFKAVQLFKKGKDFSRLQTWYSNIGNTYTKMNNLDAAEKYTRMSLDIRNTNTIPTVTMINLGKILLEKKKYREAEAILDSAMQIARRNDQKRFLSEAYYRLHELRVKQQDHKEALDFYKKYKENEDEIFSEAKAKQINEMSIQYETAEKAEQILMQRAEIAENELKLQRRNYFILGLVLLALAIGILGYLFWNQQKLKNQQLIKENQLRDALLRIETKNKLQEQRLRISRDLHDNIGAQLTFIISSIDNLKYSFSIQDNKLSDKLNQISEFASETIDELRDTIWAMNQDEITFEDLQVRINNFIDKAHVSGSNIRFNFEVDQNLTSNIKFNSITGMNIYRTIQEALNNAIKHADASSIAVKVRKAGENIKLCIQDDGKGFDQKKTSDGNGLFNMKKRLMEIGSELQITSDADGTTVCFYISKFMISKNKIV